MTEATALPAVSVIILNWNGQPWLEKFLPSVLATDYPAAQIIVADNGSTDHSVAWLREHYPEVTIYELGQNYGFAEGNTRAIAKVDTPFAVLLNSDVEVPADWLRPLVAAMEADPKLAAVQPKVRAYHEPEKFEYAGAAGGWVDRYGYAFCRGRIFDTLETDQGQYDKAQPCFWATGACMMLRTDIVGQHGLFRSELFAHWEEIDFCWRMWNLGYRIGVAPESVVYHVGGGTLPQGNARKTFYNVRNNLISMWINLPGPIRWGRMLLRLLLDGVWGAKSLLGGDLATVGAIFRGHWAFFGRMRYWQRVRRQTYPQGLPSEIPAAGYWPHSVVWAYFARGKRRFQDLMRGGA